MSDIEIIELDKAALSQHTERLGDLVNDIIDTGVSCHFVQPYDKAAARTIFESYLLDTGTKSFTWIAISRTSETNYDVAGTVTLGFHKSPNGYHRAEVKKLLVHPKFQRRGIARRLMEQLELKARKHEKKLLLLDTTADYHARKLYLSMGWILIGEVPDYASLSDKSGFEGAAFMYKTLTY